MFTTRDYLTLPPWEALIQMVNDRMYLQLDRNTTTLKEFKPLAGRNVQVTLSAARSTSDVNVLPEFSEKVFHYERLDLETQFKQKAATNISGYRLPISTIDIMRDIGARNNIAFDVDDFQHQRLTEYNPYQELTLEAHPRSLRWTGSLRLRLINTLQTRLDLAIKAYEVPNALVYPAGKIGVIQGVFYGMPYDFTPYRDDLKLVGVNNYALSGKRLAGMLAAVTGDPWRFLPTPSAFNMAFGTDKGEVTYKVAYNGPAKERYTHRGDVFNNVLILELSTALSTSIQGTLLMHYN